MPDNNNNQEKDNRTTGWFNSNRSKAIALITGAGVITAGAFGVQAIAQSKPYEHLKLFASSDSGSYGGSWHHGGWGGKHGRFSDMSDAEIEAKIVRMVKHVAIEIDATDEQQQDRKSVV